jgi:hypothetical protein
VSYPPRGLHIPILLCVAVLALPSTAHAVRPFVTDDSRIIEKGQLEMETWPELTFRGGRVHPGYHLMGGVSFTEWFELIVGAGMGYEHSEGLTVANPVIQPKFLIWRAEDNGIPGLAVGTGVTLPVGRGEMFDDATGLYVIFMATSRLFDDWLFVHVNAGFTSALVPEDPVSGHPRAFSARPYWGVGFEAGIVHPDARLIVEAYSGDPFEAVGPRYAFQWGGRWLASDHFNMDLTFGAQPVTVAGHRVPGEWEYWAQIGIRVLFDLWTEGPGDPMGARGMVRAPGYRPAPPMQPR